MRQLTRTTRNSRLQYQSPYSVCLKKDCLGQRYDHSLVLAKGADICQGLGTEPCGWIRCWRQRSLAVETQFRVSPSPLPYAENKGFTARFTLKFLQTLLVMAKILQTKRLHWRICCKLFCGQVYPSVIKDQGDACVPACGSARDTNPAPHDGS